VTRTEVRRGTEGPGRSLGSPALGGAFVATVLLLIGVVAVASRAPVGASGFGRASIARAAGLPARSVLLSNCPAARPNPHGAELRTLGGRAGEPWWEMCPAAAGGSARDATASPWAFVVMAAGAGIALAGVLGYLRLNVRRPGEHGPFSIRAPIRTQQVLGVALVVMALLIGAALVAGAILGFHRVSKPGWSFALPTWVLPLVLSALAGGIVVLLFTLRARRRPVVSVDGDLEKVDAVRVAVDASLRDLRDGQDPRRAVVAAYRRMEQTLTAAGLPRRPAETAREYVVHALTSLELRAEPPRTLTTLFERARFSVGPIDVAMRDQAIDALVAMQDELKGIG
jgi:Domain of unknown function (DUF4129)